VRPRSGAYSDPPCPDWRSPRPPNAAVASSQPYPRPPIRTQIGRPIVTITRILLASCWGKGRKEGIWEHRLA
jgi:hypothetical protein